jgi:hypothetical protein
VVTTVQGTCLFITASPLITVGAQSTFNVTITQNVLVPGPVPSLGCENVDAPFSFIVTGTP